MGHWVDSCRLEDRAVKCPVCKRTHEDMVIAENEAFGVPAHQPGGVVDLEDIVVDDAGDDASTLTHVSTPRAEAEDEAEDAVEVPQPKAKAKAKAEPKAKATAKSRAEPKPKAKAKAKSAGAEAPDPDVTEDAAPQPKAKAKAKAEPKAKATAKSKAEPKPKAKAKAKAGATPADRSAEWKGAPPPETSAAEDEPPAKRSHKAKAPPGSMPGPSAPPGSMAGSSTDPGPEPSANPGSANQPGSSTTNVVAPPAGMPKPMSTALAAAAFDETLCEQCGRFCKFVHCRMLSKGKNTWRCKGCDTKCSILRRALGSWPPAEMATIPADSQL
jgi:hypothetical protein